MTKENTTLSLRRSILLIFIISLFISVACYGALIFTNWVSSAEKTTAHMAADINEEIYNRIDTFMQVPYHMNEVNHKVIENGMLTLSDEKQRDRFFVGALESHKSVYRTTDRDTHAKEIWMYNPGSGSQFLCSNYKNPIFGDLIDDLYMVVAEACKHPKIKPDLRYAIDSFMKDDLSDDEDGTLPF